MLFHTTWRNTPCLIWIRLDDGSVQLIKEDTTFELQTGVSYMIRSSPADEGAGLAFGGWSGTEGTGFPDQANPNSELMVPPFDTCQVVPALEVWAEWVKP